MNSMCQKDNDVVLYVEIAIAHKILVPRVRVFSCMSSSSDPIYIIFQPWSSDIEFIKETAGFSMQACEQAEIDLARFKGYVYAQKYFIFQTLATQ